MQFNQQYTIELARDVLWTTLMDVHKVASCLDGVESLNVIADDSYEGTLAVKMGPVRLKFQGEVMVTMRDAANWIVVLEANAKDPRAGGGFRASLHMQLHQRELHSTDLEITLDTTFLGRMGELGRPLIKKKIGTMMDEFVEALSRQYASEEDE